MKSHDALKPCGMFASTLERLVFENSKGGLFKWYVKKHAEKCGNCKATMDALKCYQDAIRLAYEEACAEGEDLISQGDLSDLLNKLEPTTA
ncbi:MAG: hypothetical protein JST12_17620 [Armatimonadetes bacterium]|nr:hypothetical protein [Armatimonadota bacterium]